jgi:Ala-tRNA(Pro) deacylase
LNAEDRLYADLTALDISYEVAEHEAVFTVEESQKLHRDLAGAHTKNLFLKDAGGQYWLVTVPADARVDLKTLPTAIGSKRISFGKADDMDALLGISPGSVTPLAAINDTGAAVKIVIAADFSADQRINVHPLRNTATLGLATRDLLRALAHWGHNPIITAIPILELA